MSTISCPDWDIETISEQATKFGFDGVDFRGLGGEIDATKRPEFTEDVKQTKAQFADSPITISAISSSIGLGTRKRRDKSIAEARRAIVAAEILDIDYIRVHPSHMYESIDMQTQIDYAEKTMSRIQELDWSDNIEWVIETHGEFCASTDILDLYEVVKAPNVGLLWDTQATTRLADESPDETADAIGDLVEYVHMKDAKYNPDHPAAMDDGYRYAVPGQGELPLEGVMSNLVDLGYDGWLTYDYEKLWYDGLKEPDEANPEFVKWFRSLPIEGTSK
jgi:sugar phosphate isomerase/epimerase